MRILAPDFLQARVASAVEAIEAVADRVLLVIVLMIVLGRIEARRRQDLGRDRFRQSVGELLLDLFGDPTLLLVHDENRGAILAAAVAELAAAIERIDGAEEMIDQRGIADAPRIVDYLDRFDMAGAATGNLLVSRILDAPADVAGGGREHPGNLVEIGFGAPETAAGEHRDGALA